MRNIYKTLIVVAIATVLTTLGINASDNLGNLSASILGGSGGDSTFPVDNIEGS